jgi:hypothetical protein
MNSGGAGDASGATYNGSASKTISYNTIGAPSTTGTNASGNWGINVTGNSATTTLASNSSQLGGYNANNYAAFTKLNSFSVGGNTSNWYPVLFSGDYWGNGPLEIEFLRTSVHQDSSSYGYLYSKVRGHSTSWGHHGDFWEFENLIQSGTYAGFVNNAQGNPFANDFVVWLRGGMSYYWRSNCPYETIIQNNASTVTFSPGNQTAGVKSSLDAVGGTGRFYQTDVNPKNDNSFSLGNTNLRWYQLYVSNAIYSYGDIIAYYSDRRLKENIVNIETPLQKVLKLNGVTFDWNDNPVNQHSGKVGMKDIGLIAQEVEAVEPLLTTEWGDEERGVYKTIKYDRVVSLLVEAIKEQHGIIQNLEKRVSDLESK